MVPASQLFSALEAQAVDRSTHFHAHIREKSDRVKNEKNSELSGEAPIDTKEIDPNTEDSKSQSQDPPKEQPARDEDVLPEIEEILEQQSQENNNTDLLLGSSLAQELPDPEQFGDYYDKDDMVDLMDANDIQD